MAKLKANLVKKELKVQNYPNALKLQILQAESVAHKKIVLKFAERLFKEIEANITNIFKWKEETGVLLPALDIYVGEWFNDLSIAEEEFLWQLEVDNIDGELLAAITKIKEESFGRLHAMIDSYERMAAEDLPTPQPPVEFSTKTGTVLRLVPTER